MDTLDKRIFKYELIRLFLINADRYTDEQRRNVVRLLNSDLEEDLNLAKEIIKLV